MGGSVAGNLDFDKCIKQNRCYYPHSAPIHGLLTSQVIILLAPIMV